MHVRPWHLACAVIASTALFAPRAATAAVEITQSRSLVVGQAAKFAPGDRLLTARVGTGAAKALHSAADWRLLQIGELIRGPLVVQVERAGQMIELELADGIESVDVVASDSDDPLQRADDALLAASARRDWSQAERAFQDGLVVARADARAGASALIALHGAQAAWMANDYPACRARIAAVMELQRDSLFEITLGERDVVCSGLIGTWRESQQILNRLLDRLQVLAPKSLAHARVASALAQIEGFSTPIPALARVEAAVAQARARCGECQDFGGVLNWYGDVLSALDRDAEARHVYLESLRIARAVGPDGYFLASRLRRLARAARLQGELDQADAYLQEALTILRRSDVLEREFAAFYNGLGTVALERGDFAGASARFHAALDVVEHDNPDSIDCANAHHNLGVTLGLAGDFPAAESELRIGRTIIARHTQGVQLASFIIGLADLEVARGDDLSAEPLLLEARAVQEKANSAAPELGETWLKLAQLYSRGGRDADAEHAWATALAIFEQLPSDSFVLADPISARADAELARGHLTAAQALYARALALYRTQAPDSWALSRAAQGAGWVALRQNSPERARPLLEQALAIRVRDVPGTAEHAETLHALGRLAALEGDPELARKRYCEASRMLDTASSRVGGDELGEARFRSRFGPIYHDCVASELERGHADAALEALERSRARGFRHALEQRRVHLSDRALAGSVDNWAISAAAEAVLVNKLQSADLDAVARRDAQARLTRLRDDRRGLARTLGDQVAGTVALKLDALRARLAPDEAYLAYSVGAEATLILVVRGQQPVYATRVAIGESALSDHVRALRTALLDRADAGTWAAPAEALHRQLIAPVAAAIDGAEVLLIGADGPLQDLPFALLRADAAQPFLIAQHALALVDSLSAREPRAATDVAHGRILAVGDPDLGDRPHTPPVLSGLATTTGTLAPLPAARREVEQLADRYRDRVDLLSGVSATEARVREHLAAAEVLHFAVHALVDRAAPLDSALILRVGDERNPADDGLLRMAEVLEQNHLDADLVVLSACETALGKQLAGEGLLGFARAFALAGARTTIASLWSVEDRATADLMARFYAAREHTPSAARALQSAIVATLAQTQAGPADPVRGVGGLQRRGTAASVAAQPILWAGFQVYGD